MSYSVFFDFDGTLLCPGKKQISHRTLKAMQDAQKRGHKIFLNTGRAASFLDMDALRNFPFDGYLCGCGYIRVKDEILLADRMTPEELKAVVTHFSGRSITVLLEGEETMWSVYGKSHDFVSLKTMEEVFKVCEEEPITKMNILAHLSEEDMDVVRAYGDPIKRDDVVCTEVVKKGHDKGFLIAKTVELLNLDPEKVIAVGDSTNDLAMLKAAPISVAMGQATDIVKSCAKYVTSSVEEDGAALILENLP